MAQTGRWRDRAGKALGRALAAGEALWITPGLIQPLCWSYPASVLVQCCPALPRHLRMEVAEWQNPSEDIVQTERGWRPHTLSVTDTILFIATVFFTSI